MGKMVRSPDLPPDWHRFRFASCTRPVAGGWRVLVAGFAPGQRPRPRACADPAARHPRFSFHLVLAGRSTYQVPDAPPQDLQPGSFFVLRPQVDAPYPELTPGFLEAVVILDRVSAQEVVDLGLLECEPACGHGAPVRSCGESFQALVRQMELPGHPPFPLLEALAWIRQVRSRCRPEVVPADRDLIHVACRLLAADLDQRLSARAVARRLGCPYETFRKRFRAATGVAPGAFRIGKRIEAAWGLLAAGVPVAAVARRLGYCDPFVFSTQFKEHTGQPPSAVQDRTP